MKPVAPGEVIYRESPYVHVVSDKELKNHCSSCFKSASSLKHCSRCKLLRYCNSSCQKADWSIHKQECPFFIDVVPEVLSESIRMLLRIIIRYQNGDHTKMISTDPYWKRSFSDLMSHLERMQQDELRCKQFAHVLSILSKVLEGSEVLPPVPQLWEFFGKMVINSYSIHDELHENVIGSGVYLGASYLDHQCCPNAIVSFSGTKLAIRALEPITQPLPNQVFISYIQNDAPSWERREELLQRYYFRCLCSMCTTDAEQTDKQMTSVKCFMANCDGFTGIKEINNDGYCQLWPCVKCKVIEFPTEYVDEVCQLWLETRKFVKDLNKMFESGEIQNALDSAEENLKKVENSLFHESNLNIVSTMAIAKDACISLQLWEKAAVYSEKVLKQVPQYSSCINIMDSLSLLKLAKLYIYLDRPTETVQVLDKCEKMVRVTHGEDSALHQQTRNLQQQCNMLLSMHCK
ncbi:Hypothetical predicted protein [Octopus vulgaris]|uniref:MYND-type domain-containing protein n=2 Tax=Octopus vulgaris TaxID=6645 RepID=A0AA36FGQ4_OCTVU|nr:Hypothetical predicted protein [Octopus vulgaris]